MGCYILDLWRSYIDTAIAEKALLKFSTSIIQLERGSAGLIKMLNVCIVSISHTHKMFHTFFGAMARVRSDGKWARVREKERKQTHWKKKKETKESILCVCLQMECHLVAMIQHSTESNSINATISIVVYGSENFQISISNCMRTHRIAACISPFGVIQLYILYLDIWFRTVCEFV